MTQTVKNLPAMQETWVQSPGGEDPLEKGMATHSNILAWKIPWTGEPGRLPVHGVARVGHDLVTNPPPQIYQYYKFELVIIIYSIICNLNCKSSGS